MSAAQPHPWLQNLLINLPGGISALTLHHASPGPRLWIKHFDSVDTGLLDTILSHKNLLKKVIFQITLDGHHINMLQQEGEIEDVYEAVQERLLRLSEMQVLEVDLNVTPSIYVD